MLGLDADLLTWLHRHHHVASVTELRDLGLTPDRIRGLVRGGALVPVHRGVYRAAGAPLGLELQARAACAARADYVVGGVSAGHLWEFRRLPRPGAVLHVLAPPGSAPRGSGSVSVRRSSVLEPEDVVHRPDGIRLTSPPRTAFDLAASLDAAALESVVEQVIDRHCGVPTLWRTARRLEGAGRTGSAAFRRLLSSRGSWQRPAGSDLELRVLRGLEERGIRLVRQHPLVTRLGLIHLDGADPRIGWGLEVDHVTWHGGRFDAQYDKARDRAARAVGWEVERVTDGELGAGFDSTLDELAESYHRRAATRPPTSHPLP